MVAVATFVATIATLGGTDIPAGTAVIAANNVGASFSSRFTWATGFQGDDNNPPAGETKDKLINQDCGATLKAAGQ